VFTARYGLILYMQHVTFRLLKVNVRFSNAKTSLTLSRIGLISRQVLYNTFYRVPKNMTEGIMIKHPSHRPQLYFTFWFLQSSAFVKAKNKIQICRLIYYSISALHVSVNVFAHHQAHLTLFTVSGSIHPSCCRLVSWMS
jgi:hypothetical protein